MDEDFKNRFYEKLKANDVNSNLIESIDELIKYKKFSSENLMELINGEFDE